MACHGYVQVSPREGEVEPLSCLPVTVSVLLDDASCTFRDVAHLLVSEGDDVVLALEAQGEASCHVCLEAISTHACDCAYLVPLLVGHQMLGNFPLVVTG